MASRPANGRRSLSRDLRGAHPAPNEGGPARDHVFDATALLCVLFAEEGADQVQHLLPRSLVSTVNYHEVLAKLAELGVALAEARAMVDELGVGIVAVDRKQAEVRGALRNDAGGKELSLGERSCLALAKTLGVVAVTTDRDWSRFDHGVTIKLIRQPIKPNAAGA